MGKKEYIYDMNRFIPFLLVAVPAVFSFQPTASAYSDHRGWDVDSLETVVSSWTPERISAAPDSELTRLVLDWEGLMEGFLQINGLKSEYYARKVLAMGRERHWDSAVRKSARIIGQHFWAKEQYDSAAFYFKTALEALVRMDADSTSPTNPEGYSREEIDDGYSSLYGALGNLYNMMDSLDIAFAYYAKAGEIFDRYGWNESNAVLNYNMGETWLGLGEYGKARECYEASLRYGREAGDSLWIANPLKGLGALYIGQGRTRKGLRCLEEADRYFSIHEDQEFRARIETLDLMGQVLSLQKKQLRTITLTAILLALLTVILAAVLRKAWIFRRQRDAADEAIDEAIEEGKSDETTLTERETEILPLIASGMTSPQIADKLFLSLSTIKWHRKRLLEKFDSANTAELISKAKEKGFI